MEFKVLGNKVTEFAGFETFDKPDNITVVNMESNEVTALCPVTGQPDQYRVGINYIPNQLCLESKTLKLYLQSFRMKGLFCEKFASTIAEDIYKALKPREVNVVVVQTPRGGVAIIANARKGEVK